MSEKPEKKKKGVKIAFDAEEVNEDEKVRLKRRGTAAPHLSQEEALLVDDDDDDEEEAPSKVIPPPPPTPSQPYPPTETESTTIPGTSTDPDPTLPLGGDSEEEDKEWNWDAHEEISIHHHKSQSRGQSLSRSKSQSRNRSEGQVQSPGQGLPRKSNRPQNPEEADAEEEEEQGGIVDAAALDAPQLETVDEEEQFSPEELAKEEAEFRAKYALDLTEEEENAEVDGVGGLPDLEEMLEEEEEAATLKTANAEQMDAIIKFLEDEEEGEDDAEEGEGAEEEGDGAEEEGDDAEEEGEDAEEGEDDDETSLKSMPRQSRTNKPRRTIKSVANLRNSTEEHLERIKAKSKLLEGQGEEPSVLVLGPDHPKMERFQRALNDHLKRQIYETDCEMRNLENDLKIKKKERTELGGKLYNLQHEMLRHAEGADKYTNEMEKLAEKRNWLENKTNEFKQTLGKLKEEAQKEEERELNLRESIKTLDFTEHVVREAAMKYEGELKTRALVDEKLAKMKSSSEAEKRDQDFYLDKILTHVQHMELINAGIRRQIQAHREEQKELGTYINEAVTEIDALQIEKQHLQRAWNDTIAVVRSRDEALDAARRELQKVREDMRIRESELRSLSRLISREQENHEQSVILMRRRRVEERILRNQLSKLERQNEHLKNQLAQLNKIKKAVDMDLLRANNALLRRQKEIFGPRRQLEKIITEKLRLEEQILHVLHQQSGLSKAAAHIQGLIRAARERTRNMENEVARVENENCALAIDVEKLRADLFHRTSMLSELEKRCNGQEKILLDQMKDIQQSERVIQKKTGEAEKLSKKLDKLIAQSGGVEVGPLEREIEDLERQIAIEKDQVNRLQEEWLRRQDDLVRLTTQRDGIIHQNELLRKEVFIMERKRQRLDAEVEKKKGEISRVKKGTEVVRAEISNVNARLHTDKSCHEQMDKDNVLIQNGLVAMLKDAESEALGLENEIEQLEQEKMNLMESLHEKHAENLQWEKKVHLAKELKNNLKKEQEGSTSSLKLDIHHMQVRYDDIARAQEKISCDLVRCIERRDRIISQADLNLKRDHINPKNTKLAIQRNFSQLKERNRTLLKEAADIEQKVRDAMGAIRGLEDKLNESSNSLNQVREEIQQFETKIAESSIQKHKNLIDIVLRQERFRLLESMKYGRYKPLAKTLDDVQLKLIESESACYTLIEITDIISKSHPETAVHLKLVKASITLALS